MLYRLLILANIAACLALFIDGMIVLYTPDPPLPSHPKPKPVVVRKDPEPRIFPPFPQLAREEIPDAAVPDSAIPDSGPEFEKLYATLSGVVWSPNKWESTISLKVENDPDLAAAVFSLCDCVDNRPCNIIKTNYKLVSIDVRHAVIKHLPSGVTQEFWVDGDEPPDAGKPGPKIIIKRIWTKPYIWDGDF